MSRVGVTTAVAVIKRQAKPCVQQNQEGWPGPVKQRRASCISP